MDSVGRLVELKVFKMVDGIVDLKAWVFFDLEIVEEMLVGNLNVVVLDEVAALLVVVVVLVGDKVGVEVELVVLVVV